MLHNYYSLHYFVDHKIVDCLSLKKVDSQTRVNNVYLSDLVKGSVLRKGS